MNTYLKIRKKSFISPKDGEFMEKDILLEYVDFLKADLGKNISQALFQKFKDLILDGKLPAGYMMPNENVVSEMLGVGRSTLREAYTALSVFGFIKRSKAGTFVNQIDNIVNIAPFSMTVENSDLNDLLEFRFMLEAETASYAAKRATEQDITDLRECYEKMIQCRNDINLFVDYDSKFHMQLSKATHNKLLISTMIAAKDSFEKGIRLAMRKSLTKNPRVIDVTIDLHGKILDAVEGRDYQKAYSLMKEHISYVNLTVRYG